MNLTGLVFEKEAGDDLVSMVTFTDRKYKV